MAVLAAKLAALNNCWRLLPGLQLLEVVDGKNQNWVIRGKGCASKFRVAGLQHNFKNQIS